MFATMFVIITLTFAAMKAIPGDPIAAKYDKASPEVRVRIEKIYGLDKSKTEQYFVYMKNILQGEWGLSIAQPSKTANKIIEETAPASARLGVTALVWGLLIGVLCGIISGAKRNSIWDIIITIITTLGIAVPNFVIASVLQYTFTYRFPILPPIGWETHGSWLILDRYIILPAVALAFGSIATYSKYMRESVTEVLKEDYVLLARAKGLSKNKIMLK